MNKSEYTTTELATLAASQGRPVTARYVAMLCQENRIPARKVGTGRRAVWLIPEEAAHEWLKAWTTRKDVVVEAVPAEATAEALPLTVWLAENFAESWYRDALHEAREGEDVDSIRREIVFAVCFAESYIFEWARRTVDVGVINDYFPPRSYRTLKRKWHEVPRKLHRDGKISKAPKLNLSMLGTLIEYRNGLVHARASRPATHSQPQESKPFPTKKVLEARGSGWAVGIVADLVEKLHAELGTPRPQYLVRP